MTEAEWLAGADPHAMLGHIRGMTSERKLRLFAAACCRLLEVPPYYSGEMRTALWDGIHAAERYAEGILGNDQASQIQEETILATSISGRHPLIFAVVGSLWPSASEAAQRTLNAADEDVPIERLSGVLRDIFHNPFRTVAVSPSWLTLTVCGLTQTVYQERAFDHLPILADALEDAGCTDADILNHCRQPGEHVRGCWVVDLLLGKT